MVSIKALFISSTTRRASGPDTRFARRFRKASALLGWTLMAACLIEVLLRLLPKNSVFDAIFDWFPRQPLAALVCFLLVSASVLSVQKIPYSTRLVQVVCGLLVIFIEFFSVTLGTGSIWGMDRLTAWVILLLGFVVAAGGSRIPLVGYIRQMATFVGFFLCALVLAGYIYEGVNTTGGLVDFLRIPWTSGLLGLVAGHALLLQHPNFGVMRVVSGEGFGSAVIRRLLPTTIVLLLILGWLLAVGEDMEIYPASFGESLYAVLAISGFSGMLVMTAIYLNRLDGERVSQEAALRRNQQQLQSILDNTTSIICMKDLEGRYLLVNKSFCRVVARTPEECIGKHVGEIFDSEVATGVLKRERDALQRREAIESVETISTPTYADGAPRTYLCASFPLLDSIGVPYAVCDVYTDITEIKQQEEEIKHLNQSLREKTLRQESANNELEAFSYSVSHDLRAPLRHISGFGQLLSQRNKENLDDKSRHYLAVILQSVDRMGALIDDLLAFSRASKVDLSWKRVSMGEIAAEARDELESHWTGPKVTWDIGGLPDVEGDPAMLRLVWINLLSNAMKYSGKNPAPRISVRCLTDGDGDGVFSVVDNGAGFDMRYADKLFGVFQRLHSNRDYEGTGIGLAMIRRILERHGGRIWAESSVGQGASFYFVIPTTQSAADKEPS